MMTRLSDLVLKDHNDRVIEGLKNGSEITERLQREFCGIGPQLEIHTYLEELQYPKIGKVSDIVSTIDAGVAETR